jgi:hypothetical protein
LEFRSHKKPEARLADVLTVMPSPSLANPYEGQDEVLFALEPCVGKLTSKVLMGLGFSNEPWLPDDFHNNPFGSIVLLKINLGKYSLNQPQLGSPGYLFKSNLCLLQKFENISIGNKLRQEGT